MTCQLTLMLQIWSHAQCVHYLSLMDPGFCSTSGICQGWWYKLHMCQIDFMFSCSPWTGAYYCTLLRMSQAYWDISGFHLMYPTFCTCIYAHISQYPWLIWSNAHTCIKGSNKAKQNIHVCEGWCSRNRSKPGRERNRTDTYNSN